MAKYMPMLPSRRQTQYMIDKLFGYCHTLTPDESQFYDEENMSSDAFPVLIPRKKRSFKAGTNLQGIIVKNALYHIDNKKFYKNGIEQTVPDSLPLREGEYTLVSFGAYIIMIPHPSAVGAKKIMYNTVDGTFKDMESKWSNESGNTYNTVTFHLARVDGNTFTAEYSDTEPTDNLTNGMYWVDKSAVPPVLKQWSANTGMWTQIASTYVKIECTNIGKNFEVYDGVTISGCTGEREELNGTSVIWEKGDNYIVISGILKGDPQTETSEFKVERTLPDMDYYIEANNRLWGCKYGNVGGQTVNEIYASKLGDPTNFNVFLGTAADSYAVSLGTDGKFTGAVNYLGYPIFFKEACIHKVYGQYPANYQVQTVRARGVQEGSSKSLAIVDERLFYKSTIDVCVYDGSLPQSVSADLGSNTKYDAVAGTLGQKYYIAMKDDNGVNTRKTLYVLDTKTGIWHREGTFDALQFARLDDELIAINSNDNKLYSMTGKLTSGYTAEGTLNWWVETGYIGYQMSDKTYPSRINIRAKIPNECSVTVGIKYDDDQSFTNVQTMVGDGDNEIRAFSIIPHRCHHFALKISGSGACEIYSITKTMCIGSDR